MSHSGHVVEMSCWAGKKTFTPVEIGDLRNCLYLDSLCNQQLQIHITAPPKVKRLYCYHKDCPKTRKNGKKKKKEELNGWLFFPTQHWEELEISVQL